MPLDRFVLILVLVVIAAGVTVWLGVMAAGVFQIGPMGAFIFVPVLLIGYVIWRVIAQRIGNSEDDHYDRIEK